jgi:peptidoglycan/xylan/chitin deacetylase (PgdA/CDA1 family)
VGSGWHGRSALAALLFLAAARADAAELPVLDFGAIAGVERLTDACALTFDDGPGDATAVLLDQLAAKSVKATFFLVGVNIRRYPELVRRMIAEGHEVENHSYDHPDMLHLGEPERQREIEQTETLLVALGAQPHFFRPPYGAYDHGLVEDAQRDGLEVVLWSRDSEDWRYHTLASIEGQILPGATGRAHGVFLFHDVHEHTVGLMPAILDDLRARGCRFVTVLQWIEDSHSATAALAANPAKHTVGWRRPAKPTGAVAD